MKKLLLPLFLVGCSGGNITPPPQAGDTHAIPPFEWRIKSEEEMTRIYSNSGEHLRTDERLDGFVGKEGNKWVVYTTPPHRVDDRATCTLGHEVMHIALGDYHK